MAGEGQITVRCTCGKKLKAPAESAGRKARCPACGAIVRMIPSEPGTPAAVVAAATGSGAAGSSTAVNGKLKTSSVARTATVPSRAKPAPVEPSVPDDDGMSALYELNELEKTAAVVPDGVVCPSCRSKMEANAVLCTNCGYDTRTGKSLSTTRDAPVLSYATPKGKGKKGPVDMMAPQGSFILGLVLASVFGLVCSILWIVVIAVTHFEIGILATVVGWTVGLGMQLGQKGYSRRGGIAAAIIAVLAIAGPKLLLLALVAAVVPGKTAEAGYELFHPLTILFIVLGVGAAYKTANGAS